MFLFIEKYPLKGDRVCTNARILVAEDGRNTAGGWARGPSTGRWQRPDLQAGQTARQSAPLQARTAPAGRSEGTRAQAGAKLKRPPASSRQTAVTIAPLGAPQRSTRRAAGPRTPPQGAQQRGQMNRAVQEHGRAGRRSAPADAPPEGGQGPRGGRRDRTRAAGPQDTQTSEAAESPPADPKRWEPPRGADGGRAGADSRPRAAGPQAEAHAEGAGSGTRGRAESAQVGLRAVPGVQAHLRACSRSKVNCVFC